MTFVGFLSAPEVFVLAALRLLVELLDGALQGCRIDVQPFCQRCQAWRLDEVVPDLPREESIDEARGWLQRARDVVLAVVRIEMKKQGVSGLPAGAAFAIARPV